MVTGINSFREEANNIQCYAKFGAEPTAVKKQPKLRSGRCAYGSKYSPDHQNGEENATKFNLNLLLSFISQALRVVQYIETISTFSKAEKPNVS